MEEVYQNLHSIDNRVKDIYSIKLESKINSNRVCHIVKMKNIYAFAFVGPQDVWENGKKLTI